MSLNGWLQIFLFIAAILLLAKPMGVYLTNVFERRRTFLDPVCVPCERLLYRLTGIDADHEMRWTEYTVVMLIFSAATMALTYVVERVQHLLPLNPQHLPGVESALALNTAISFTTNTNWQAYTPETTMSYLTQMLGLATHNFWSAAVGMALAVAFIRGIARRESTTLGNFWVDLTRGTFWVLLPISVVFSLALVSQGVVQNFRPYDTAQLVEAQKVTGTDGKTTMVTTQTIAQGPVASQEAIKMLGTNGGGFFNANSAHPFENPTPVSNFLQMLSIFLIPAGLTVMLGRMVGSPKHGWAVLAAMVVLWFAGVCTCYWAEAQVNPLYHGVDQRVSVTQAGGNMEGKEVRFGIANSALFATVTTDASCGAVNGMHDSFMPLGGMVPMANILLGEVVFGGVGAGLYGMLGVRRDGGVHRGPDGGPNAGVPGQEDRSVRRADGDALPAHLPDDHPRLCGDYRADAKRRPGQPGEPWAAWPERDSVRVHLGHGQQRLGVCGAEREHALVQLLACGCDVLRALHDADSDDGHRGQPGGQEDCACVGGNVPGDDTVVHRSAYGRDPDRRRFDVLSGAFAWTDS